MSNRAIAVLAVIALVVLEISGLVWYRNLETVSQETMAMTQNTNPTNNTIQMDTTPLSNHGYAQNIIKAKDGQPIKKFSLVAKESSLKINADINMPVWIFNGTVPGQEIRVTQGDFVQVELKNELKEPVTIHWHGYPLLSAMDGVPGINQDAVRPGETFTYEFSADVSGTYWYHSHQEGAKEVDKGLYGALIVEPKVKEKIDKDFTLVLDEWMSDPAGMDSMAEMGNSASDAKTTSDTNSINASSGMAGMDMSKAGTASMTEEEKMDYMYDLYTVNGKSGDLIEPLNVSKGDVVRLRFINAGYRVHGIHIPGKDIKIVSTDGQNIYGAEIIKDQVIMIAPGERYDVEFTVNSPDNFVIDAHDDNAYNDQLRVPVNVKGGSGKTFEEDPAAEIPVFDLVSYGVSGKGEFTLDQKFNIDYNVELNTYMDVKTQKYTINGKTFSELPPLELKTGDLVKFTFDNKSDLNHPMHLHGHFFQILFKNGKAVNGAPIMKDTLLVGPNEKYIVAFKANNPGNWVQHCHELHHAAGGMMMEIKYIDFKPNYILDPNSKFNNPE